MTSTSPSSSGCRSPRSSRARAARRRGALSRRSWRSAAALVLSVDRCCRRLRRAAQRGLQYVTDETWISELGIHYKLGVDGLNLFLIAADGAAVLRRVAVGGAARVGAPAPVLPLLRPRRDRRARRAHGPGPRAVRRLLRPDARAVLLPDGGLGRRPTAVAAMIKLFIYTLVGSLLMLVGGDRHRRPGARATRVHLRPRAAQLAARDAADRLAGLDLPLLRRGVPGQDAGLPVPRLDARRLQGDAAAGARGLLGDPLARSPPTASCASCCRCSPTPAAHFQELDAADRAGLDPLRVGDGVHDDATRG